MEFNPKDEGEVSKWNEGYLKNLRLHEAQELINISKINPLKKNKDGSWRFERWNEGITILFGEGESKWSPEEIKEVNKIKEIIILTLENNPPYEIIRRLTVGKKIQDININQENWTILRKLMELYEKKVRKFNDIHGLSTRNYDEDLEGL